MYVLEGSVCAYMGYAFYLGVFYVFYAISTFVGYLLSNPLYIYIYTICK